MDLIKSPLNYTGNKYRILPQIQPYFPKDINVMVDLFCGGATVGLNTLCKKVIFIDYNERVIGLLKYLASCDFNSLIQKLYDLISKYNLSFSAKNGYSYYKQHINDKNSNNGLKQYNSNGFYEIRDKYNSFCNKDTEEANLLLYLLLVYGFNNDLRFSREGKYNLPVGKTDLNRNNINKLKNYIERVSSIKSEFICGDFTDNRIQEIVKQADFVYMDPPYLIMDAVYNECGGWCEESEYKILELMQYFLDMRIPFVLSNVLEKRGKRNEPLYYWTTLHNEQIEIVDIKYHYKSSSYNKKDRDANEREIIIVPKR